MIHTKSIAFLREEFLRSKITSKQISSSFLESCEDADSINAWVVRHDDPNVIQKCLDSAPLGKLNGLLVGVKDVIATSEFPTKMGVSTKEWSGTTGSFDARIIAKLRSEGAVVAGKNTTSEFAVHLPTKVKNPRYLSSITGTSSSGSVAAVASGQVSISIATQTGGSIARPASYCGVIGFKPSFGMFPRTGILKTTEYFDTVGVVGRRVDDVKEVYLAARISGPNHPVHSMRMSKSFHSVRTLCGNTIDEADQEIRSRLDEYAAKIADQQGLHFEREILEFDFQSLRQSYLEVYATDLNYFLRGELDKPGVSDNLRQTIEDSRVDILKYKRALVNLSEWKNRISKELSGTLFLSLAASSGAPEQDKNYPLDPNPFWTIAGVPQIVVPVLRDRTQKLIGVSLTSIKGSDLDLLAFAKLIFPMDSNSIPSL